MDGTGVIHHPVSRPIDGDLDFNGYSINNAIIPNVIQNPLSMDLNCSDYDLDSVGKLTTRSLSVTSPSALSVDVAGGVTCRSVTTDNIELEEYMEIKKVTVLHPSYDAAYVKIEADDNGCVSASSSINQHMFLTPLWRDYWVANGDMATMDEYLQNVTSNLFEAGSHSNLDREYLVRQYIPEDCMLTKIIWMRESLEERKFDTYFNIVDSSDQVIASYVIPNIVGAFNGTITMNAILSGDTFYGIRFDNSQGDARIGKLYTTFIFKSIFT